MPEAHLSFSLQDDSCAEKGDCPRLEIMERVPAHRFSPTPLSCAMYFLEPTFSEVRHYCQKALVSKQSSWTRQLMGREGPKDPGKFLCVSESGLRRHQRPSSDSALTLLDPAPWFCLVLVLQENSCWWTAFIFWKTSRRSSWLSRGVSCSLMIHFLFLRLCAQT